MRLRGGLKLANRWEEAVYIVVKRCGENLPVYEVRPESGDGPSRTLHRNMLLPCRFDPTPGLTPVTPPPVAPPPVAPPPCRRLSRRNRREQSAEALLPSASESESGDEGQYVLEMDFAPVSPTNPDDVEPAPRLRRAPSEVSEPEVMQDEAQVVEGPEIGVPPTLAEHDALEELAVPMSPVAPPPLEQIRPEPRTSGRRRQQTIPLSYDQLGQPAAWSVDNSSGTKPPTPAVDPNVMCSMVQQQMMLMQQSALMLQSLVAGNK